MVKVYAEFVFVSIYQLFIINVWIYKSYQTG